MTPPAAADAEASDDASIGPTTVMCVCRASDCTRDSDMDRANRAAGSSPDDVSITTTTPGDVGPELADADARVNCGT